MEKSFNRKHSTMLNFVKDKILQRLLYGAIPNGVSSYPFISGDTFRALASNIIDVLDGNIIIKRSNLKNNIYFVEMDLFNSYDIDKVIPKNANLIIHNGDAQPRVEMLQKLITNDVSIYSVNLREHHRYKNCYCIPIGIENAHWNKNGALNYYNSSLYSTNQSNRNPSIITSFNVKTNINRRFYYQNIANEYGYNNSTGLSLKNFRTLLQTNMFILSPPGNGIDCHRTWVAIYHGCIPVIEKEDWLFANTNLPVLIVDTLYDFFNLSELQRTVLYHEKINIECDFAYMNYWITRLS